MYKIMEAFSEVELKLPSPSAEQTEIIGKLTSSHLIVDSVAGSGKTTLNLHLALAYPDLQILLLTYNARLKTETRVKVATLGIDNLEVHSYHSWAVKYLDSSCHTDAALQLFLKHNTDPNCTDKRIGEPDSKVDKLPYYDLIIIDEAQDLTPLYYQLVAYLYYGQPGHIRQGTRLCIVGDKYQSIYGFQNADPRMITLANYLFNFDDFSNSDNIDTTSEAVEKPQRQSVSTWTLVNLSTSFRVTQEVAQFLNRCLLGYDRICGHKSTGSRPRYLICDCFMGGDRINRKGGLTKAKSDTTKRSTVYDEVMRYFGLGYRPNDIFVLAPSIRSNASPVRQLANRLTLEGIDVYVPVNDEEKLDDRVVAGKVVFSSFHQVKGLERPVVLVFNFDDSYFKYYKSDADPSLCPNEIYVALTRSTHHLSIFHHYGNDWMPFLCKRELYKYCEIIESRKVKPTSNSCQMVVETGVTDLIRHLSLDVSTRVEEFFNTREIRSPDTLIKIPHLVPTSGGYENVSEINGTAIPAYFEWLSKRKMSIYRPESLVTWRKMHETDEKANKCVLDGGRRQNQIDNGAEISEELLITENNGLTISKLMKVATLWTSYTSGYLFKLRQIRNYNWLNKDGLSRCKDRLKSLKIGQNAQFEQKVTLDGRPELINRRLTGYIDLINDDRIFELKCVESLKTEHFLQLTVYMYLFLATRPESEHGNYHFYLYNILSDQLVEVDSTFNRLSEMMGLLIRSKYFANFTLSDEDFVRKITNIRQTTRKIFI